MKFGRITTLVLIMPKNTLKYLGSVTALYKISIF
jgi:hypothetical protein